MAIIKKYLAEIVHIENIVDGIYTLELKSHSGRFKYLPGQFLHLALDEYDPSIGWPESRCFSIQSSPKDENIRITYARKGIFTLRMSRELREGSRVTLKLPYGDLFTQVHSKENTVFVAGGTGITPFLSLFNDDTFAEYQNPKLYAGFRTAKMNLYNKEIEAATQINPKLKSYFVFQDKDGILDIEKIYQQETKTGSYFISGPPEMINKFKTILLQHGVAMEQIKTDDWE
jgi:ferredoxin-NADP reductase